MPTSWNTLRAPTLPSPASRTSMPPTIRPMMKADGIDPTRYPMMAAAAAAASAFKLRRLRVIVTATLGKRGRRFAIAKPRPGSPGATRRNGRTAPGMPGAPERLHLPSLPGSVVHDIEIRAIRPASSWAADHVEQYLATEGAAVDHPLAERVILLYTRGRRSGRIRVTPLVHLAEDGDRFVVASAGGSPEHPAWYHNLRDDSRVWIRDKAEFFPATATTLAPEERSRIWTQIVTQMPFFADYQARVDREIPVVRLSERDPDTDPALTGD